MTDLSRKLSPSHKEFFVSKPKNVLRSINRKKEKTKTNENSFSIYSPSSSSETLYSASYLPIYERRKTAEQATSYAKQTQERSHRKLKLLEKSFGLLTK